MLKSPMHSLSIDVSSSTRRFRSATSRGVCSKSLNGVLHSS